MARNASSSVSSEVFVASCMGLVSTGVARGNAADISGTAPGSFTLSLGKLESSCFVFSPLSLLPLVEALALAMYTFC